MINLKHLTFSYLNKPLLKNLNLHIDQGDIIAIIGPSGSGKTTLFKLIAGLETPQNGSIEILGEMADKNRRSLLSYMMQEDLLLPWKTALENLMVVFSLENPSLLASFTTVYRKRKKLFKQKALQIMQEMGLHGFEHYYPNHLSGGMRQRLSLARSLLFNKPILLLDEPFGAIDVSQRKMLYQLIKKIKDKYKLTILFITHDLTDALQLSDHIYFLDQGTLKKQTASIISSTKAFISV